MVNTPAFKLTFSCPLRDIWKGDNVYIKTKDDRFSDPAYPDHVIATVLQVRKPSCSSWLKSKVWTYTFSPLSSMPAGIVALENCDVEGIRLSRECCILSGEWRGDEIVLTKENGEEIVIAPPEIGCSLDDADFNGDVALPQI